jgi:hypothetical protein
MTFAELMLAVHDWRRRMPPARVRRAVRRQLESEEGVEGFPRGFPVGAALVMVRMGVGPDTRCVALSAPEPAIALEPASCLEAGPEAPERGAPDRAAPVSARARELVRSRLAHGPRPGAEIEAAAEAAAIPERSLIAAASSLGVRTRKGRTETEHQKSKSLI